MEKVFDEFVPNPDEKGFLIMVKRVDGYGYLDSDLSLFVNDSELVMNTGHSDSDLNKLQLFKLRSLLFGKSLSFHAVTITVCEKFHVRCGNNTSKKKRKKNNVRLCQY